MINYFMEAEETDAKFEFLRRKSAKAAYYNLFRTCTGIVLLCQYAI